MSDKKNILLSIDASLWGECRSTGGGSRKACPEINRRVEAFDTRKDFYIISATDKEIQIYDNGKVITVKSKNNKT